MKRFVSILMVVFIVVALLTQPVEATGFNFIATPNRTTIQKGDMVQINLNLTNIDAGELGINTVECTLQYDKEFFENLKINSKNNWSITYNESTGKLLAVLVTTGVTTDQEIGTITINIKQDTTETSGSINFTEVASNDGKNLIPTANQTVKISLAENGVSGNKTDSGKTNSSTTGAQSTQATNTKPSTSSTKKENISNK